MSRGEFGWSPPGSVGVEEELVLVDAETCAAVPGFSRLVGAPTAEVKPELFESLIELATPVLPDARAALDELRRLRASLAQRAGRQGIALHAAGAHALARGAEQPLVPLERYRRLKETVGTPIYRQLVCGLHVHVSVADPETCLRAFEGVVPWLPTLLALSANSPFAEGVDTGRRSERAVRLLEMPTGGTPPVLRSWDDWEEATQGDDTRRHWDAWPRPEYGTLEVRVMDVQTDVRRSAGFAELVAALVAAVSDGEPRPYDRELYASRRDAAVREPPDAAEVEALGELVAPHAGDLAAAVLAGRPEAERQLELAAAEGIAAVPPDVVARTLAF
ncbi:MAG TPA: YbdK family carboxylate-amine ligase [Gaiellaceae bacterium]|nr:YbdK family carboxylate-amine ligase [Gaiellaceae bacterium]